MYITIHKQAHRYREQASGHQCGEGRGNTQNRGMELRNTNYHV